MGLFVFPDLSVYTGSHRFICPSMCPSKAQGSSWALLGHTETKMALTDTALKALKPRGKPYTVTDGRGLYVEVFPTGGIVWRDRDRLDGKRSAWAIAEGGGHFA